METLQKIKSIEGADNFFWWIREHPEITMIQGWEIERYFANDGDNNYSVTAFGVSPRHSCDVSFLYEYRRDINDWIDRYLNDYPETV